ncbi:MAG: SPOR domain-containing protein [Burkholderiaceae bacterium]
MTKPAFRQSGGTLLGFILGLVIGLGIAVAVALYITNAPVPFVTKVKPASDAVNPATAGDPNKPLYAPPVLKGGTGTAPTEAAKGNPATDPKAVPPPPEKGTPPTAVIDDGSRFLLQAGAFKSPDDADAMRARLALLGFDSKVFPREQDGTTLYRVRLGPYGNLDDVNRIRKTMAENGIDVQLIRLK